LEDISLSTESQPILAESDELYLESDDTNPLQIIYDLDNNRVIVPTENEDTQQIEEIDGLDSTIRQTFVRNVRNSRRRYNR
jgi:hypothetical protein